MPSNGNENRQGTVGELMIELIKHDPNLPVSFGVSYPEGTYYSTQGSNLAVYTPQRANGETAYLLLVMDK